MMSVSLLFLRRLARRKHVDFWDVANSSQSVVVVLVRSWQKNGNNCGCQRIRFSSCNSVSDSGSCSSGNRTVDLASHRLLQRAQSSWASVNVAVEPEEEEKELVIERPRLASLRERLKKESSSSSSVIVPVVKHLSPKPQSSSSKLSSPDELRRWVDSLPHVPNDSLVLTDTFHRQHTYLRLSLTERCNLRCTYCMPENGVPLQPPSHLLQTDELLQLAAYFRQHGVTKFRLTGGEPTLRHDLVSIVRGLRELQPKLIGMTTNGVVLASKLPELVEAGLNSVNLSLDTLDENRFARLTRRPANYLGKVWKALEALQEMAISSEQFSFKLNCVVMRNVNTDEIADFVRLTLAFPNVQVRFIEYMPFTENGWNGDQCVSYEELLHQLKTQDGIDLRPVPSDDPSDTTKWYHTPWTTGTPVPNIGFITSMSNNFCGTCNRLRLTADGQLKVCLFGQTELSLRDALRAGFTDEQLSKAVYAAVQQKHYQLGGHPDPSTLAAHVDGNRPMTLIGG